MTTYTYKAIDNLLNKYIDKDEGVDIYEVPGSLLDGYLVIPSSDNLYCSLIKEVYLNEYSSAYTIRMFNKNRITKKMLTFIDLYNQEGASEKVIDLFYTIK